MMKAESELHVLVKVSSEAPALQSVITDAVVMEHYELFATTPAQLQAQCNGKAWSDSDVWSAPPLSGKA